MSMNYRGVNPTQSLERIEDSLKNLKAAQAKLLEEKRALLGRTTSKGVLWEIAGERPISYVGYDATKNFAYYQYDASGDVIINGLLLMCKSIHNKTSVEYEARPYGEYANTNTLTISRIEEMTDEELAVSGEMLGKIVAIYNEYYSKLNSSVHVTYLDGMEEDVPVVHDTTHVFKYGSRGKRVLPKETYGKSIAENVTEELV